MQAKKQRFELANRSKSARGRKACVRASRCEPAFARFHRIKFWVNSDVQNIVLDSDLGQTYSPGMLGSLDSIDRAILRQLQEDGSLTNVELSARVGLTPAPTLERVRRLERDGFIRRYVALVDQRKVGRPVTAFVSVILESHNRENSLRFREAVAELPEVLECHHIAGEEDFLLKVVAESPEDYERFVLERLTDVGGIEKVKTTFVLSSPKVETAIPIDEPGAEAPVTAGDPSAPRRRAKKGAI